MSYYVWYWAKNDSGPLRKEGPYGPFKMRKAAQFARIGAKEGEHDRVISQGANPRAKSFKVLRRYEAGTGERIW